MPGRNHFDVLVVNCMLHGKHRVVEILLAYFCYPPPTHSHIQTIHKQQGILFASPALVHRVMYSGRGVIAPNTKFCLGLVDSRGYLPVEWWVMSKTEAKNPEPKENEGGWRKGEGWRERRGRGMEGEERRENQTKPRN